MGSNLSTGVSRTKVAGVLLFAICLALVGSLPSTSTVAAPSGSQIIVAIKDDVINLDPARMVSLEDHQVANAIYNGLMRYKAGSLTELEPDLATNWSVSADGKTYTFELRRGVRWHKKYGEFTAADVKYSFDRVMTPATASPYRGAFGVVDRIETEGNYRVRIHLKTPSPSFFAVALAFRPGLIVNRRAIEEKGENYVNDPIGTGPFVFEERRPGDRVVLARNLDYFGTPPRVERVVFKRIHPEPLIEIALRGGEAHMYYFLDTETITRMMRQRILRTEQVPPTLTTFMYFHTRKSPWSDVRVRRAVAHAINRQEIADYVFRGLAKPATSIVPPAVLGHSSRDSYPLAVDRAKQLMTEAGVSSVEATLLGFLQGENQGDIAAVIKENLKAIGIDVRLNIVAEWPLQLELLRSERFDLAMTSLGRRDPDQFYAAFHSQFRPYPNAAHVARFDGMIEAARVEVDGAKRGQMYLALHQAVIEDMPILPLVYLSRILAFRPEIQGVKADPGVLYNLADISVGARR